MSKQNGVPCWIDLGVKDIEAAKAFYSAVFGWEFMNTGEEFGSYNMASKNGKMIGGMMQNDGEYADMPVAWTVYLKTDDIAATAAKITANGGQMYMDAMQVGDTGSMAIAGGPDGAAVGLWQPDTFHGTELMAAEGAPCWFQLSTKNFDASVEFYGNVFPNLAIEPMPMDGMRYATFKVDGEDQAGVMDASFLPEEVPSYWGVVLGVNNTDEAVTKIVELGGSVVQEAMDTEWGRMATVSDPQGGTFAIIQVG